MNKIKKGDIVFFNDDHEAWMCNLITDVIEVNDEIARIRTRNYNALVEVSRLTKLPVDKDFPIYSVTKFKPKYSSPD